MADRIDLVLDALRCPVCAQSLRRLPGRLACADGHSYDVARQGYVNLVAGGHPGTGDDTAMVAARDRFLSAGDYRPIERAVVAALSGSDERPTLAVDLAGGTGHYLAAVLDARPRDCGVVVDLSTAALRRATRSHERAAAVGADAWAGLPLRDGCVGTVLSVFGPRSPDEVRRILAPDGLLVCVSPRPDHLRQLVDRLGLLSVGVDKTERLSHDFGAPRRQQDVTYDVGLTRDAVRDVVAMGPSARHVDAAVLETRLDRLGAAPVTVTVSVRVSVFRPAGWH